MISTLPVTLGAIRKMTEAESSLILVRRAHDGDQAAINELFARYLPRLQRWAHGRLPSWARGSLDTHDLVQDTFMQVLKRLDQFEPRHEGAFQGYLRQALFNRVRDEIRRVQRRGPSDGGGGASDRVGNRSRVLVMRRSPSRRPPSISR